VIAPGNSDLIMQGDRSGSVAAVGLIQALRHKSQKQWAIDMGILYISFRFTSAPRKGSGLVCTFSSCFREMSMVTLFPNNSRQSYIFELIKTNKGSSLSKLLQ
jgi:hypothetical protein